MNYPYCCGVGDCFPCVPDGYNKTRCGAPPPYCNKTQSCEAKLNSSDFVPNLKVKTWVAIEKVWEPLYVDTTGPRKCVFIREVSLGDLYTRVYTIGTSETD